MNHTSEKTYMTETVGQTIDPERLRWERQVMFYKGWRSVFGSDTFRKVMLYFGASALVSCFLTWSAFNEMALFGSQGMRTLLVVIMMLPTVLVELGLWLLYRESKNAKIEPVKPTGLSLIATVITVGYYVICFLFGCLLVFMLSETGEYFELPEHIRKASDGVVISCAWLVFLIVATAMIGFWYSLVKMLENAERSVAVAKADTSYVSAVRIFLLITLVVNVVLTVISAVFTDYDFFTTTIPLILSCGQIFAFCTVLAQYKTVMDSLANVT